MIVCTRTGDSLSRSAFGKNNVAVSKIDAMMDAFKLDPNLTKPSKEAFVITSDDVRSPKVKQQFLTAAATKHKDVKIVYIIRSGKDDTAVGNGIDVVLTKPKPDELAEVLRNLVETIASKAPIMSSADEIPKGIEKYTPKEFQQEDKQNDQQELEVNQVEEEPEELHVPQPEEVVEDYAPTKRTSSMVDRINECNKVADIHILTKELTAAAVVKDLIKENQEYASIENKLKGIQEKMYTIMADKSIKSLEERLDRVRALVYDKEYYKAKNNTVIEQRIEDIIKTITEKTKALLTERLRELDDAILNTNSLIGGNIDFTRLAGINDERANMILELSILDKEIRNIFYNADTLVHTVAAGISESEADLTGNPLINAHIRMRGEHVVSESSLDTLINILSTCERTSDEFKDAINQISIMQKKLNKLLDLDKETIAAQTQIINYLRANNIEDTVVAESLIKKSLRVFVGIEGTGRTVVPLVLSRRKSRQNANTLYVDITGTAKTADYDCDMYTLDDWMQNRYEKEFCTVVGKIGDSVEAAQRLLVALTKAADYYRVINVVIAPEQMNVFNTIANDVLCVNYIVDTDNRTLAFMKEFINNTKFDNVAQRVIINKCSVSCKPIVESLGLLETLDVNVVKIPYILQLVDCSLNKIKPYELTAVVEGFEEVSKYA